MIELRWIERKITRPIKQSDLLEPIKFGQKYPQVIDIVKVLQYRQAQNTLEVANEIQPPIWSDWVDVPNNGLQE